MLITSADPPTKKLSSDSLQHTAAPSVPADARKSLGK